MGRKRVAMTEEDRVDGGRDLVVRALVVRTLNTRHSYRLNILSIECVSLFGSPPPLQHRRRPTTLRTVVEEKARALCSFPK